VPNEFVFRPEYPSFVFLGCDRHKIGKDNFCRSIEEACFEDILRSTIAPKIEELSKRGQQSQSIEPRFEMSAADRPSPMIA